MDNSTVLGLVPAYSFSQYLVLEANKHQTEHWMGWSPQSPKWGMPSPVPSPTWRFMVSGEFLDAALPWPLETYPGQCFQCKSQPFSFWKLYCAWGKTPWGVLLHSGSPFSPLSCATPWVGPGELGLLWVIILCPHNHLSDCCAANPQPLSLGPSFYSQVIFFWWT